MRALQTLPTFLNSSEGCEWSRHQSLYALRTLPGVVVQSLTQPAPSVVSSSSSRGIKKVLGDLVIVSINKHWQSPARRVVCVHSFQTRVREIAFDFRVSQTFVQLRSIPAETEH